MKVFRFKKEIEHIEIKEVDVFVPKHKMLSKEQLPETSVVSPTSITSPTFSRTTTTLTDRTQTQEIEMVQNIESFQSPESSRKESDIVEDLNLNLGIASSLDDDCSAME